MTVMNLMHKITRINWVQLLVLIVLEVIPLSILMYRLLHTPFIGVDWENLILLVLIGIGALASLILLVLSENKQHRIK